MQDEIAHRVIDDNFNKTLKTTKKEVREFTTRSCSELETKL